MCAPAHAVACPARRASPAEAPVALQSCRSSTVCSCGELRCGDRLPVGRGWARAACTALLRAWRAIPFQGLRLASSTWLRAKPQRQAQTRAQAGLTCSCRQEKDRQDASAAILTEELLYLEGAFDSAGPFFAGEQFRCGPCAGCARPPPASMGGKLNGLQPGGRSGAALAPAHVHPPEVPVRPALLGAPALPARPGLLSGAPAAGPLGACAEGGRAGDLSCRRAANGCLLGTAWSPRGRR